MKPPILALVLFTLVRHHNTHSTFALSQDTVCDKMSQHGSQSWGHHTSPLISHPPSSSATEHRTKKILFSTEVSAFIRQSQWMYRLARSRAQCAAPCLYLGVPSKTHIHRAGPASQQFRCRSPMSLLPLLLSSPALQTFSRSDAAICRNTSPKWFDHQATLSMQLSFPRSLPTPASASTTASVSTSHVSSN